MDDTQQTNPAGRTSKAIQRLIVAFRRAALLTARRSGPTVVSAQAVEQSSRQYPFPETRNSGDERSSLPDAVAPKSDARSPHWPWPSTVNAVSGELASKLRPEVPAIEPPSRELFGRFSRVLVGFLVGLVISWIVLSIYPIHTELHNIFAANTPPTSDSTKPAPVRGGDETAAPIRSAPSTSEPVANPREQVSPGIGELARRSNPGSETAAAPAVIPSVPLGLVVKAARGSEDTVIPLAIGTTRISDEDAENLTITVAGLPEGARLSAGRKGGVDSWTLRSDQLSGLTLTPPDDYSGSFELSVSATVRDAAGNNETATMPLVVKVSGVADLPSLAAKDSSGSRRRPIPLVFNAALTDRDGSESLSVVVTGAPEGTLLSAGRDDGADGWILTPGELEGLTLRAPAGFSGRIDLTVAATALEADGDSATATAPMAVNVNDATDHLALSVEDAAADKDSPVRLEIDAVLNSSEAAEQFSITIAGVPEGARLSAGRDEGGGKWLLSPSELPGLSLRPPSSYSGRFELRVAATVRQADGDIVTATAPLAVRVARAQEVRSPAKTETLSAGAKALSLIKGDPVIAAAAAAGPGDSAEPRSQTLAQTRAKDFMARGNQLLELGDIAAARLFFELAMDHGDVRAATAVGKTYDPFYLRERGVLGAGGDPNMAMSWYKRAIEAGDLEAVARLKALAN